MSARYRRTYDLPRCEVCSMPMVLGQRRRHGACSPGLLCCGWPTDLAGDLKAHAAAHRERDRG